MLKNRNIDYVIDDFMIYCVNKDLKRKTINNYIRNLKVFFNFLENERIIKKNPITKIKQFKNITSHVFGNN